MAASFCFIGLAGSKANAQEAASSFKTFLGYFGVRPDSGESIDYRARPPVVVPPRFDLPQPKEAASDPSWPRDPDIASERRAAVDSHTPVAKSAADTQPGPQTGRDALPSDGPRDECEAGSGTAMCVTTPWKMLKSVTNVFHSEQAQPGPEPARKYLVEPPAGYRQPVNAAKAGAESQKDKTGPAEARATARAQHSKASIEK
ncbi:MAG: hypothetical protein J2P49_05685 [Methylocapsa sp.]|nr:hypothetical protein [Methylocapsa sp.]